MSHRPDPSAAPPSVTAHPPERGRRGGSVTLPCACCCCCCCCLHTLGGLAGGVAGSVAPIEARPKMMDPDSPFPFRRDEFEDEGAALPAAALYWMLVGLTIVGTVGYYVLTDVLRGGGPAGSFSLDTFLIGLLLAFMVLPGLQLVASVLSVLVVLVFYPSKGMALQRIGRITLWSFVGCLAGLAIMGAILGMFLIGSR